MSTASEALLLMDRMIASFTATLRTASATGTRKSWSLQTLRTK